MYSLWPTDGIHSLHSLFSLHYSAVYLYDYFLPPVIMKPSYLYSLQVSNVSPFMCDVCPSSCHQVFGFLRFICSPNLLYVSFDFLIMCMHSLLSQCGHLHTKESEGTKICTLQRGRRLAAPLVMTIYYERGFWWLLTHFHQTCWFL